MSIAETNTNATDFYIRIKNQPNWITNSEDHQNLMINQKDQDKFGSTYRQLWIWVYYLPSHDKDTQQQFERHMNNIL
ncbi:hypothetical protein RclHR1_03840017 [Rhizophagus clarus]|uniref:Uncharacterized protein n=1 Tax=Rhizophagus clarus TaxID=94130 RepID=A0A2Z6RQC6_9GLOM|nr:hypothetical protein RclHR1_03840017 [Rhizophagus clarus]